MDLFQFADKTGQSIIIRFVSQRTPRFYAMFDSCDIGSNNKVETIFGEGDNMSKALHDYCEKIKGKFLIMNPNSKDRKMLIVPKNLTV